MKKIIVALDGHSSCGKSTMARWLAREAGYIYVDTGAMYRAVTLFALRQGFFSADGTLDAAALEQALPGLRVDFARKASDGLPRVQLSGEDVEEEIRGMQVSSHVSPVAALPFVRKAMTAAQQAMGHEKGIVMDGRDIGTAVFPEAELKIFVTASADVRARRRYDELTAKGQKVDYAEILRNVQERDYIDSHREIAPLRCASDALVLDNSRMTREEQNEWLLQAFRERTNQD